MQPLSLCPAHTLLLLCQDYAACVWPPETPGAGQLGSEGIAAALDALNEQQPGWAALQRVLSQAQRAGGSSAAGACVHAPMLAVAH